MGLAGSSPTSSRAPDRATSADTGSGRVRSTTTVPDPALRNLLRSSVLSDPGIRKIGWSGSSETCTSRVSRSPVHDVIVTSMVCVTVVAAVTVRVTRHVAPVPIGVVGSGTEYVKALVSDCSMARLAGACASFGGAICSSVVTRPSA